MAFYSKLVECFTMSEEKEDYAFDEKKLADLLNELQRNIKLKEPDNIHAKAAEPDNMMQSFKRQNLAADILRKYLKKNILNVYNKEDKADKRTDYNDLELHGAAPVLSWSDGSEYPVAKGVGVLP